MIIRLQQLSTGAINVPDKNDERRLSKQAPGLQLAPEELYEHPAMSGSESFLQLLVAS